MNSYVGMTIDKKEQGQDEYFQSTKHTSYVNATDYQSTYGGW